MISKESLERLETRAKDVPEANGFTAFALDVRNLDGSQFNMCEGHLGDPKKTRLEDSSLFDLASLTKVLFPTTYLVFQVQNGLDLNLDLRTYFEDLPWHRDWKEIRLVDVLSHQAGFRAWKDLFQEIYGGNRERWLPEKGNVGGEILKYIASQPPIAPARTKTEYSDLGFIFLSFWMERYFKASLNELWESVVKEFELKQPVLFEPLKQGVSKERIVATEEISWRGGRVHGEVHDDNTYLMSGISTHAGLFGTLDSVSALAWEWLKAYHGKSSVLDTSTVREFLKRKTKSGEPRGIGWMMPSGPISTGGRAISKNSFGHLGYTGTSIWIDLDRATLVVLLTNRVYGSMSSKNMNQLRSEIHDTIWKGLS